jgi:Flp pilus assembly protein CpaB
MTYRVKNIALAFALAIVAALLTTFYVSNYKKNVQQAEEGVQVFVAARDIPAGTTGAAARAEHLLETRRVARRTVVPGAISSADQIDKLVAGQPIYAGEQVSLRRFSSVARQGVHGQLKGTMRAVQLPGDGNQLLAGTLEAGDHVDFVGNFKPEQEQPFSRIVLRDLVVLKAPSAPVAGKVSSAATDSWVLLRVRDSQVQKLFFTMKNGDWTLELRPTVDPSDGSEVVENYDSVRAAGRGSR